jgi:ABC-type dipeptide/oligopeptide/nickel transport system permease subunit
VGTAVNALTKGAAAGRVRGVSYWGLVWQRMRADRLTMVCLGFVVVFVLVGILAPWIAPTGYNDINPIEARQRPTLRHLAGTDELGRDIFSRLLYSLRNAILVAFVASLSSVVVGCLVGAVAGYQGGIVDTVLVGIIDIMYAFPSFLFSVVMVTVIGRGIPAIIIAIAVTSWVGIARLMRGQVLSVKNRDFVLAGQALGASRWRILLRYIIPNSLGPLIVSIAFMIPSAMLAEGALSILGLGIAPPMPSWGNLINTGSTNMRAFPYQLYIPAGSFALVLLAFTYLGDGLNRAMNPRD